MNSHKEKDYYYHENRPIPEIPWKKVLILAFAFMFIGVVAWEYNARVAWSYDPEAYIDSKGIWTIERRRIDHSDKNTVAVIGSSRILFDLDLNSYEQLTGTRPIQLALVGTSPRPLLKDLASDEDFVGLLIMGITPGNFFSGRGGLFANNPKYYVKESPTQRISQQLSMLIEPYLAFYDNSNWPLFTLIGRMDFENNVAKHDPVSMVWTLSEMDKDRNTKMFWKVEDVPYYQKHAQATWQNFFDLGDKFGAPPFDLDEFLEGVSKDINTIRTRGGDVVFVRTPSSDVYRDRENKFQPRDKYWDRLLSQTNSVGVHFEDHPELQGFRTPEWSHLHSDDAPVYTSELVPILDQKLKEVGKPGIIDE